jgi:hypothetical protein
MTELLEIVSDRVTFVFFIDRSIGRLIDLLVG